MVFPTRSSVPDPATVAFNVTWVAMEEHRPAQEAAAGGREKLRWETALPVPRSPPQRRSPSPGTLPADALVPWALPGRGPLPAQSLLLPTSLGATHEAVGERELLPALCKRHCL